jgi:ribosome-associated protein
VAATPRALDLAQAAAHAAQDKLAEEVIGLDVSGQLALTDIFVIASAPNERQVSSIVDAIEERLLELGSKTLRREGQREGRWVLMDFGDIVVHVMHTEDREFYDLERLWKDCPVVIQPEE